MFRFRFILILLLIFSSTYSLANSKFEKDLKKISKNNGFVDNKEEVYSSEQITDKKNTILIIYTHGSSNDQKIDKCLSPWNKVPSVLLSLHNKKIKNYHIKIYRLCSGVKGWSKAEQTKMWEYHKRSKKLSSDITDKNGTPLIKKQKQLLKQKILVILTYCQFSKDKLTL